MIDSRSAVMATIKVCDVCGGSNRKMLRITVMREHPHKGEEFPSYTADVCFRCAESLELRTDGPLPKEEEK